MDIAGKETSEGCHLRTFCEIFDGFDSTKESLTLVGRTRVVFGLYESSEL